jgi:CheY-like chemotaxis protein
MSAIKQLNVLVVEDNPDFAEHTTQIIQQLGHTPQTASSGFQALRSLASKDFDLVFMDIEMPQVDGWETTRLIRQGLYGVKNPKIPVVALTGRNSQEDQKQCYDSGMDYFVSKPANLHKLNEAICKINPKYNHEQTCIKSECSKNMSRIKTPSLLSIEETTAQTDLGEEQIIVFYNKFTVQFPEKWKQLAEANKCSDYETMRKVAHNLKNVVWIIGANKLREMFVELESLAKNEHPNINTYMQLLEYESGKVMELVKSRL